MIPGRVNGKKGFIESCCFYFLFQFSIDFAKVVNSFSYGAENFRLSFVSVVLVLFCFVLVFNALFLFYVVKSVKSKRRNSHNVIQSV